MHQSRLQGTASCTWTLKWSSRSPVPCPAHPSHARARNILPKNTHHLAAPGYLWPGAFMTRPIRPVRSVCPSLLSVGILPFMGTHGSGPVWAPVSPVPHTAPACACLLPAHPFSRSVPGTRASLRGMPAEVPRQPHPVTSGRRFKAFKRLLKGRGLRYNFCQKILHEAHKAKEASWLRYR